MDTLSCMRAFVQVVDSGSFTKAAGRLQVSAVMVTKQVAALEQHLGVRLLNRTTRRSSLTEAGHDYCERCRRILDDVAEAETIAKAATLVPSGTLRVTVPVTYGMVRFAELALDFAQRYPQVSFDLAVNDQLVDLVAEGFDLAVRIAATLETPNLVVRKLATTRVVLCASPEYLRRFGTPNTPQDLNQHRCLIYTRAPRVFKLEHRGKTFMIEPRGFLHSENITLLQDAALKGGGIAPFLSMELFDHLRADRLRLVLPECPVAQLGVYAVYPHRRLLTAKVRAFIDFLVEHFGGQPDHDRWWAHIEDALLL